MPVLQVEALLRPEDLLRAVEQLNSQELEAFTRSVVALQAARTTPVLFRDEGDTATVVIDQTTPKRSTGHDMAHSDLFGIWANREDIDDSAEYALEQRARAWTRPS